uniref:RecQ-mediated genome instability protein 1 n=1 Tax=Salarias fasciatus TaxID=181472 RepID=A0A672IZ25_SALFA
MSVLFLVVRTAQAWLQSSWHVRVPFAWLEACVGWLQEEAGGAQRLSQQQINQQVLDQWLLTDLRDLDYPVLPEGLAQAQKTELSGTFCIQVDSLLDVSQPAYAQLQKWRGTDCSNDEVSAVTQTTQRSWEARPTRMLLLQVTDGVQSLEAMEYQFIPELSADFFFPPLSNGCGAKLQLQGKIVCRLGVLLLGPSNVKVLGGEVEDLVERNSKVIHGIRFSISCSSLSETSTNSSRSGLMQSRRGASVQEQERSGFSPSDTTHSEIQDHHMADEDFPDEDFDDLPLDELDNMIFQENAPPLSESRPRNTPVTGNVEPGLRSSVSRHTAQKRDRLGCPVRVSGGLNAQCDSAAPAVTLTSKPFTYLCVLEKMTSSPQPQTTEIHVKAFIVTLLGKLSSSNGVWSVRATISDGTGYLDVELSDEVLTSLLGFSVPEKGALKRDPARRAELDAGMRRCQEELVDMCCVMTITVEPGSGKAVVTKADPVSETALRELEQRARERRR